MSLVSLAAITRAVAAPLAHAARRGHRSLCRPPPPPRRAAPRRHAARRSAGAESARSPRRRRPRSGRARARARAARGARGGGGGRDGRGRRGGIQALEVRLGVRGARDVIAEAARCREDALGLERAREHDARVGQSRQSTTCAGGPPNATTEPRWSRARARAAMAASRRFLALPAARTHHALVAVQLAGHAPNAARRARRRPSTRRSRHTRARCSRPPARAAEARTTAHASARARARASETTRLVRRLRSRRKGGACGLRASAGGLVA